MYLVIPLYYGQIETKVFDGRPTLFDMFDILNDPTNGRERHEMIKWLSARTGLFLLHQRSYVGDCHRPNSICCSLFSSTFVGSWNRPFTVMKGGQGGLVVKRLPGNQKVGGSNPTTATW